MEEIEKFVKKITGSLLELTSQNFSFATNIAYSIVV